MTHRIDQVLITLASRHHGVFTIGEARDRHVSHQALASRCMAGVLERVHPGVLRMAAWPETWLQAVAAASLAAPAGAIGWGPTGLALHGLVGATTPIHLATRRGGRIRLKDVVGHQVHDLPQEDVVEVEGIKTTNIARSLVDAARCAPDLLLPAFDEAWRRGTSLEWIRQTAARRAARPGPSGARRVLDLVLAAQRSGRAPDSWFERLVELSLTNPELPAPVRQHVVRDAAGQFVARLDLAFPPLLLGVEAHSRRFHGPSSWDGDAERELRLTELGWHVVYVGWRAAIESPEQVLASVLTVARQRRRLLLPTGD